MMMDRQRRTKAGRARGGDELDGAEALLLLLGEQRPSKRVQKAKGEENVPTSGVQDAENGAVAWYAAGEADPLSQGTRSWLQLLGHLMGVGNDEAMIEKLLTAAEVAVSSMQNAPSNPVHAHLRDLHTLLRRQGPAAAAAGAAALLAARGANHSKCTICNLSCLTVRKVGTGDTFRCTSPVALFPQDACAVKLAVAAGAGTLTKHEVEPPAPTELKRRQSSDIPTTASGHFPTDARPSDTQPASPGTAADAGLAGTPTADCVEAPINGEQSAGPSRNCSAVITGSGGAAAPAALRAASICAALRERASPASLVEPVKPVDPLFITGASAGRQWCGRTRFQVRVGKEAGEERKGGGSGVGSYLRRGPPSASNLGAGGGSPGCTEGTMPRSNSEVERVLPLLICIKRQAPSSPSVCADSVALPILPLVTKGSGSPADLPAWNGNTVSWTPDSLVSPLLNAGKAVAVPEVSQTKASNTISLTVSRTITSLPQHAWQPPPVGSTPRASIPALPLPIAPYRAVITSGESPKPSSDAAFTSGVRRRLPRLLESDSPSLTSGGSRSFDEMMPPTAIAAGSRAGVVGCTPATVAPSVEASTAATAGASGPSRMISTGGLSHQGSPQLFLPSAQPSALIRSAIVSSGHQMSRREALPVESSMLLPLTPLTERVSSTRGNILSSQSSAAVAVSGDQIPLPGVDELLGKTSSSGSNLQSALSQLTHQLAPPCAQSPGGAAPVIRPAASRQLSASLQHAASLAQADVGLRRPPLGSGRRPLRGAVSEPITSQNVVLTAGMVPRAASLPNPSNGAAAKGGLRQDNTMWQAAVHGKDESGQSVILFHAAGSLPSVSAALLPSIMHVEEWKPRSKIPMATLVGAPLLLDLGSSSSAEQIVRLEHFAELGLAATVRLPGFDFTLAPHRSSASAVLHLVGLVLRSAPTE